MAMTPKEWETLDNFSRIEFLCACCGQEQMQMPFMKALQQMRGLLDAPILITSGYRCLNHNKNVGGAERSYHLRGRAADLVAPTSAWRYCIVQSAMKVGFTGIGIYEGYIHVDDREGHEPVMWMNRGGLFN